MAKTIEQLIDWTYKNRAGVLKDRDLLDILSYFQSASVNGIVWHFEDRQGLVTGIVLATLDTTKLEAYVSYARLTTPGLLKQAFAEFRRKFPSYTITAHRYGQIVHY